MSENIENESTEYTISVDALQSELLEIAWAYNRLGELLRKLNRSIF